MDLYTNSMFQVQKGRGLVSSDQISKFWDPNDFWMKELSAWNLAQT